MTAVRTTTRVARRIGGHVVSLVLVLLTLAAVGYIAPTFFGYERYVLTGGSMTGTYDKGSIVFEKAVPIEELEVGDVITYQPPADAGTTDLVTHRITKIGHDEAGTMVLRTQGDANPDPDPWKFSLLDAEQPVVEHGVPYAGWALIALADRQVRMLVVGVPAALVALLSLGQLLTALRPRRRDHAVGGVRAATGHP
jgi:signal peptidase